MPSFVIKPVPDRDFYCEWNYISDGPGRRGDKESMLDQGIEAERIERADTEGTSAVGEAHGIGKEAKFYVDPGGLLPREHMEIYCRLQEDGEGNEKSLLEPEEDEDA